MVFTMGCQRFSKYMHNIKRNFDASNKFKKKNRTLAMNF